MTKCTGVRIENTVTTWFCPYHRHCQRFLKPTKDMVQSWIAPPFNDKDYSCELYIKVENEEYNRIYKI